MIDKYFVTIMVTISFGLGNVLGQQYAEPTPEQKEIIAKHERILFCEKHTTKAFCKEIYER